MIARRLVSFALGILALTITTTGWAAAAPSTLSYQAVLQNTSGQPVTTSVSVVFTIYDASSGGNTLWTETRNVTPDAVGRLNLNLGETAPINESVFNGPDRWLGIKVGADPEMAQRTKMAASAYSRRVSTVDGSTAGTMDGALTLRSTAASEEKDADALAAQLKLISIGGDTIVVGPADQLVFRATDPTGAERMSATISGPNGPALGIRDPGGNHTEHTGTASSYYKDAGPNKDYQALSKKMEVTADGIVVFGATENDTVAFVDNNGGVYSRGLHVETDPPAASAEKEALPCGASANCGNPNMCVGSQNNLLGTANSMAIGSCNRINSGTGNFTAGVENLLNGSANYAVALGYQNVVQGGGALAMGRRNMVTGFRSVALGGDDTVLTDHSFAAGVENNIGAGGSGSVVFGTGNRITATDCAAIGRSNNVQAPSSVAIGAGNAVDGSGESICMGDSNRVSGANAAILGGEKDTIYAGANTSIAGGKRNVTSRASWGFIGSGERNRIGDSLGDVNHCVLTGGNDNFVNGQSVFCGGGSFNEATGNQSVCAGGDQNTVGGGAATVAGGSQNTANGAASMIPGGELCDALGFYSFAAGRRAKANHDGAFVWADANNFDFPAAGEVNFTPASNNFLARATGGAIIVTGVDGTGKSTSGVVVPAGSGSWAVLSDKNAKENVRPVNTTEVLNKLAQLDIASWNYQAQDDAIRHIGPMAQDLYAAFGYGEDERHISSVDADGIALAAIQALYKKTQELESQKSEIEGLRDQVVELKQLVESMARQR